MKTIVLKGLAFCLVVIFASFCNLASAQVDTSQVAVPDTTVQKQVKEEKKDKKDSKRKDEFIPYVGINFNNLGLADDSSIESTLGIGYHIGFNYKRGKFFYWQAGLRYNNAVYELKYPEEGDQLEDNFAVRSIDIPVTGGINFLSAVNRIVALRLFISAVPAINFSVGDNNLNISKDDINSFILYGQAGLGVNVAFLVLEAGYNFGFQDLLVDYDSKPGQVFINLGFRF